MDQRRIVKRIHTFTGPEGRRHTGTVEIWTGTPETGSYDATMITGANKRDVAKQMNCWLKGRLK